MSEDGKKYKLSIDLKDFNPRTISIKYIHDNAYVLDVGCACGDLGVALKEYKNAKMYGFEYNKASVEITRKTGVYEEVHPVNLDELTLSDFPQYKNRFDYVVCNDVLEHLRSPTETLKILKKYVKDGGFIIASIPNVAHMSIKANLLVDDFTYTPIGLLDETHIHLFTYKSIAEELTNAELKIAKCQFTTKYKNGYQPNNPYNILSDDIKYFLFSDWHSYVCQYVMKISVAKKEENLLEHNLKKLSIDEHNAPDNIKKYHNQLLSELKNTTRDVLEKIFLEQNNIRNQILSALEERDDKRAKKIKKLKMSRYCYRFALFVLLTLL